MELPNRNDYIEQLEYNGVIYTSVNEDAWLHALKLFNRKKNIKFFFQTRKFKRIKSKNIIKLS